MSHASNPYGDGFTSKYIVDAIIDKYTKQWLQIVIWGKIMIDKIKNNSYFKTILFFIYEGIYLIFIDFFNQYLITRNLSISGYFVKTAIVFNILWVLLYFIILQ